MQSKRRHHLSMQVFVYIFVSMAIIIPTVRTCYVYHWDILLLRSVKRNDYATARECLLHGADANMHDDIGTPYEEMVTAIKCIIKRDPRLPPGPTALQLLLVPNGVSHGQYPIRFLYPAENSKLVRLLLDHGADPNAVYEGDPPLVMAIGEGKLDTVQAPLAGNADANYCRRSGETV